MVFYRLTIKRQLQGFKILKETMPIAILLWAYTWTILWLAVSVYFSILISTCITVSEQKADYGEIIFQMPSPKSTYSVLVNDSHNFFLVSTKPLPTKNFSLSKFQINHWNKHLGPLTTKNLKYQGRYILLLKEILTHLTFKIFSNTKPMSIFGTNVLKRSGNWTIIRHPRALGQCVYIKKKIILWPYNA